MLAKAEFLIPGGSHKDRVALDIIIVAFGEGRSSPASGGVVPGGTVGSTGARLAMVSPAYVCRCFVAMADDAAIEKSQMLEARGAEVQQLRPVSIV